MNAMPLNHKCLPAIVITLLPNFGFFVIVDLTEDNGRWYSMLEHPSWGVTTGEIYFPLLLSVNLLQGYASFLVWEVLGRNWWSLPLMAYSTNLFFLWIHFPIFLGCRSLMWGSVDITLALITGIGSTVFFLRELKLAGYLMIPYVCLIAYDALRDYWMAYKNKTRPKGSSTVANELMGG